MDTAEHPVDPAQPFRVEDWLIDPSASLIQRDERTVHLEPKVMDLLVFLAQAPGQVFSRNELLDNVWSGVIVSDEALTNAIIKLRKAFGDKAKDPRYFETVPKRGYRLIAAVHGVPVRAAESAVEAQAEGPPLPGRMTGDYRRIIWSLMAATFILLAGAWMIWERGMLSESANATDPADRSLEKAAIVVLPLVNVGNEIEHGYFSDGLTDDLITDLSKLSALLVISRNSAFKYKGRSVDLQQVVEELNVGYILQGSVRRNNDRVRVNVELFNATTNRQQWSERYDGTLQDVFALQDQITARIISSLRLQLTDRDRAQLAVYETDSPEAYDEFLKGYEFSWRVSRESFARAEKHFLRALEIDPQYSRANAALAMLYVKAWTELWHENTGSTVASWRRARKQLTAAMRNPTPLAYAIQSTMNLQNKRYEKAIADAQAAIRLDPNSANGYLTLAEAQAYAGLSDQAINNTRKALRLDPNFPAPYLNVEGRVLYDLKQYDKAVATLQRALLANPRERNAQVVMIAAYGQLGRLEEAEAVQLRLNQNLQRDDLPELTINWLRNNWPYRNRDDKLHLHDGLKKAGVTEW